MDKVFLNSDDAVLRVRVARFLDIEKRRKAIGAPINGMARAAGVTDRSYRRWLDGDRVPTFAVLAKLTSAIAELEREALGQ